jgi:hypothetical protein
MNFNNKFKITTNRFYIVFHADEGKEGEFLCLHNGSISDFFIRATNLPLVMYAGKAIKAVKRELDEKLERSTGYSIFLKTNIISLSNTINELSKYSEYDLVGIYAKEYNFDYKIVNHRTVEEHVLKDKGYKFVEITKETYTKLASMENTQETRKENERKVKEKTIGYNENKPIHAHTDKQDNSLIKAEKTFTSFITNGLLTFAVVAIPICLGSALASAVFEFLIK